MCYTNTSQQHRKTLTFYIFKSNRRYTINTWEKGFQVFPEHINGNLCDGEKLMGTQGGSKFRRVQRQAQGPERDASSREKPYWGSGECSQERQVQGQLGLGEPPPGSHLDWQLLAELIPPQEHSEDPGGAGRAQAMPTRHLCQGS